MRESYRKQLVWSLAVILLATLLICSGCASTRVITKPYMSGRILLLPPRDVIQSGAPHPKGEGSGLVFQDYLKSRFAGTAFELVTTDSKEFSAIEIAAKEKGLEEGRRLNTDYCLQVVLGEFQNAAPMTFRPDYVFLNKAVMYDVRTGENVWQLVEPLYLQKGNPGNHLVLLDGHASTIASSICENMNKTIDERKIVHVGDKTSAIKQDLNNELLKLKELKDKGVLTEEEFDIQKKKILERY